jgi:hypothetical protein
LSSNQIFIIIQIGLIPSIISIAKIYSGENNYKFFYIYIIGCYLMEIISNRLIHSKNYEIANCTINIFLIIEFIILKAILHQLRGQRNKSITLIFFVVGFWLYENIFLHKIFESEKYFNTFGSIIIFIICIFTIKNELNKNLSSFFKEPSILIILTILFNFSFRIVFEFLYYNYEGNLKLMKSISNINLLVNFITNILFIYCLVCIKKGKKLISSF